MTGTVQQENILTLIVGMFDAAAGAQFLAEFEVLLTASDDDYLAFASYLAQSETFASLYPESLSDSEFASVFIERLVADEASDSNKSWAIDWLSANLQAGMSRSAVMFNAIEALNNIDASDSNWGNAHQALVNQTAAAYYYSIETGQSASDLATLQAAVAGTTSDITTIPTTPLNLLLANYVAAHAARSVFLASADNDDDSQTSATAVQIADDLSAVIEQIDVVVDGPYATASAVIKAALLADQMAVNTELFNY